MAAESDEYTSSDSSEEDDDDIFQNHDPTIRTFVDFENDKSAPNVIVKSFMRDCFRFPKILCHKEFLFFRIFLEELTGMRTTTTSRDAPFSENHDDTTFCVGLYEKTFENLQYRVEDTSNDYLWASIIPLERRSDLGLAVFRWNLLPMTKCYLQLYIDFCRLQFKQTGLEKGENIHQYIKEFSAAFKIDRNDFFEDLLKGDLEATRLRKLCGKIEPTNDLCYKIVNAECPPPSKLTASTKTQQKCKNSSDSSSETASSKESTCSEYKGKQHNRVNVKKRRTKKPQRIVNQMAKVANGVIKKPSSGKPNGVIKKPVNEKPNGVIKKQVNEKPNGVIRNPVNENLNGVIKKPNGVTNNPSHGKANGVITNGIHKPKKVSSPSSDLKCDICWPTEHFSTKRLLLKHMNQFHNSARGGFIRCKCGSKVTTERYEFHKEFCKEHDESSLQIK